MPLSPGVYIQELDTGARPIEAVGTSTAGFIGVAPNADAAPGEAVAITNWSQFQQRFVAGKADDTGKQPDATALANAVYGFFLNGGSRCYVVNTDSVSKALALLDAIDEIAIIAAPGRSDAATHQALLTSAETLKDRFAILDGPPSGTVTSLSARPGGDAEAPADGKDGKAAKDAKDGDAKPPAAVGPPPSDGGYGAYYFPWLRVRDAISDRLVSAAPSGHIAGIYARTDTERGVHKAPANVVIRGALSLTQTVSDSDQGELNDKSVNCLRYFSRDGIRVWGARTVANSSSQWRYVNVRRLFNMVEESIAESTRWVVFEPNDRPLWKAIERDVGAFLTLLWRQGALQGATPREAFFVKCDEETNPQDDIDRGQVTTLIGLAPVKPAEFVVFRIGQSQAGAVVQPAS